MTQPPRPPAAIKLQEAADPDALAAIVVIAAGQVADGILERTAGVPALCCPRCARILARRVDPVKYRGMGMECGACGAVGVIG